ncbi:hypothetical protein PINS_up019592 [Pythium insidiosum]|nr:hypothetical protein PINS_up019592 [Pythium insidiosum]
MVSLHAHEGSQNGIDHSAPVEMWKTQWSDKPENVKSSLRLATFIAKRYKNSPAFLGMNLMNEPTRPTDYPTLLGYYKDAYKAIRETGNDCIIATSPWLEHQSPDYLNDLMRCPDYYNVWHEFHVYYKWGWEKKTKEEVFEAAGSYKKTHITPWHGNPLYIGEWSLATPDEIPLTDDDFAEFAAIQMKQVDDAGAGWGVLGVATLGGVGEDVGMVDAPAAAQGSDQDPVRHGQSRPTSRHVRPMCAAPPREMRPRAAQDLALPRLVRATTSIRPCCSRRSASRLRIPTTPT